MPMWSDPQGKSSPESGFRFFSNVSTVLELVISPQMPNGLLVEPLSVQRDQTGLKQMTQQRGRSYASVTA